MILKGKKVSPDLQALETPQITITVNSNAWQTEESFLLWLDKIWRPYCSQFERSLLILDEFRVHKTQKVLEELEKLKTDVLFIPPGMTWYLQLCDVLVNKPLKDGVRNRWQNYMAENVANPGNLLINFAYLV